MLGEARLDHHELVLGIVFFHAQRIEQMLVDPEDESLLAITRQPVFAHRGLKYKGVDAAVAAVMGVVVAHHFDRRSLPLDELPADILRDGGAGVREADGLVEHIGAEQLPGQLPGIAPEHVVKGL